MACTSKIFEFVGSYVATAAGSNIAKNMQALLEH